jgi:hypothetical protein
MREAFIADLSIWAPPFFLHIGEWVILALLESGSVCSLRGFRMVDRYASRNLDPPGK